MTADDYIEMDANDVLETLVPGGQPVDGVEIDQDWDGGATIVRFGDGSALRISGPTVELVLVAAPGGSSRASPRYRVTPTPTGCTLWLRSGYAQRHPHEQTCEFWAPEGGGYVFEELPGRPATSGRQVCESLFGLGSTLESTREALPGKIRRLAKRHCDEIDREWGL